jgi:glycine dehydrogenase subunit 2
VGVTKALADFLPSPVVDIVEEGTGDEAPLYGFVKPVHSIGQVKSFYGQFGMLVRAFTYIRMHGPDGLRKVSEYAVLNANYLMKLVKDSYTLPYDRTCMHEFVLEGVWSDAPEIHALDVAKRLMDYDFHPPTNYFPLIVHEALMIEPTETENKQTLDQFAEALVKIAEEAHSQPDLLHGAPHNAPVGRLDEVKAAKDLVLCCWIPDSDEKLL